MATAVYDNSLLPCMIFPFKNTHTQSKRYLGNTALTGKVYATVNILCKDDAEMAALHSFYRTDTKYGFESFILKAPMFGFDTADLDFLAEFDGDFAPVKENNGSWKLSMQLQILAPISLIYDDAGDPITDDNGEYIYAGTELHPSSDNIISYTPISDIVL